MSQYEEEINAEGKVRNPRTGKYIAYNGSTHKSLIREGVLPSTEPVPVNMPPKRVSGVSNIAPASMARAADPKRHIRGKPLVELKHPRPALHLSDSGSEEEDAEPVSPRSKTGGKKPLNQRLREVCANDDIHEERTDYDALAERFALEPEFEGWDHDELIALLKKMNL